MVVNEGTLDRVIRVMLGAALLWLGMASAILSSPLDTASAVVGVVMLVTGITGFCGLYKLLGISTCERPQE